MASRSAKRLADLVRWRSGIGSAAVPPTSTSIRYPSSLCSFVTSSGFSSDVSSPSGIQWKERKLIAASQEHMFAVIADVNQYHEFVPYVTRSREWDDRGSDKYKEAELEVGFSLITEKYTSKIELEPFSSVTTRTDDSRLFSHLTSRWRLSPGVSPTSCWVDFDVDFGFRSEIYGRLADVFLEDVVKKMMAAFEARARQLQLG